MVTHRGAVESSGTGPLVLPSALDKSVALRKSGLVFARIIPFRTWECVGQQLFAVADSSTWWIADWLAYGESTFQSRYYEATQKTSLKYQTLRNYAWVARRFELSRRRDNLSFGHHAEVSALDRPEQDYWLRKAEELGWSRNQLRAQVRTSLREREADEALAPAPGGGGKPVPPGSLGPRGPLGPPGTPGPHGGQHRPAAGAADAEIVTLRLTSDQVARFTAVARRQNLRLGEWAVEVLDAAARSCRATVHPHRTG